MLCQALFQTLSFCSLFLSSGSHYFSCQFKVVKWRQKRFNMAELVREEGGQSLQSLNLECSLNRDDVPRQLLQVRGLLGPLFISLKMPTSVSTGVGILSPKLDFKWIRWTLPWCFSAWIIMKSRLSGITTRGFCSLKMCCFCSLFCF